MALGVPWPRLDSRPVDLTSPSDLNRLVRTRMLGGVGAGEGDLPGYPMRRLPVSCILTISIPYRRDQPRLPNNWITSHKRNTARNCFGDDEAIEDVRNGRILMTGY